MNKFAPALRFIVVVIIAHTLSYLIIGWLAYEFFTKAFWTGANPLLASYLRTPGDTALWNHVMTWQVPGQILRAFLLALVLLPLLETLAQWKFGKTAWFYALLLFIYTHFASAVPSSANLEGLVYMKPEYVLQGFWKMQPEMIAYCAICASLMAKYAIKKIPLV